MITYVKVKNTALVVNVRNVDKKTNVEISIPDECKMKFSKAEQSYNLIKFKILKK